LSPDPLRQLHGDPSLSHGQLQESAISSSAFNLPLLIYFPAIEPSSFINYHDLPPLFNYIT
jgi:hypothetical protein